MKTQLKKTVTFKVEGKKYNHSNFLELEKDTREKIEKSNRNWFEPVLLKTDDESFKKITQELDQKNSELEESNISLEKANKELLYKISELEKLVEEKKEDNKAKK